ncbi:MAG: hypothetical protein AAGU75_06080, partial [Bacillota bacterium]
MKTKLSKVDAIYMVFNSLQFILFFPIVMLLYFLILPKYKNLVLLIASYYFYMCWNPGYAILIIISTTTTYFCGYFIIKSKDVIERKRALAFNIIVNLFILFF